MGVKQEFVACVGEFTGTTLFLLLALGGAKTAQFTRTSSQTDGLATSLGNQDIIFIAVSFGLSLLTCAWVFYRVTGGLFNPAITLALYLIGGIPALRASLLFVSQILGGIAGAALVSALTPFGGVETVTTTLDPRMNVAQGLFLEAFLTAILVLTVLLLAAEKHKSTHLAPIGIGLVLLACHLFGVVWTGCGINPARAFGPSVVSAEFPGYHWIYWIGPFLGSVMSVSFYLLLKACEYTSVVFGQDADHEDENAKRHVVGHTLFRKARSRLVVLHGKDGDHGSSKVVEYDENNKEMRDALRSGQASMVHDGNDAMDMAENGTAPVIVGGIQKPSSGDAPSFHPSRRGSAQQVGVEMAAFNASRRNSGLVSVGGGGSGANTPSTEPRRFAAGEPRISRNNSQDAGAMQTPGTAGSGLANLKFARNFLSHTS